MIKTGYRVLNSAGFLTVRVIFIFNLDQYFYISHYDSQFISKYTPSLVIWDDPFFLKNKILLYKTIYLIQSRFQLFIIFLLVFFLIQYFTTI